MKSFPALVPGLLLPLVAQAQTPSYYLPPAATFVRAVVSVETTSLSDPTWRAFADRTSSILATAGHAPIGSLVLLATATGRPEVAVAPVVPYGLSSNGRRAMQTAVANPGRCVALLPHHPGRMFMSGNDGFNFNRLDGSVAADTLFDFTAAFPVPAIFLAGERDNLSGFVMPTENCLVGRRGGNSPWCLITEPNTTHTGSAMPAALVTTILEGMMQRRLPAANWPANQSPVLLPIDVTTGWLGNLTTKQIASYASYPGDRAKAIWLPDAASANAWAAYVVAQPFEIPPQSVVLPVSVANLQVFDPANSAIHPADQSGGTSGEAAWKVCGNLQTADFCYVAAHGAAVYSVPPVVAGAEWIRPMEGAAAYTGVTLLSFNLTRDAEVYIAHQTAITTKPTWLSTWADTGLDLTLSTGSTLFAAPTVMRLFKKSFTNGQLIELGPNGGSAQSRMYLTIVKPAATSGSEVSLVVSDANAAEAGLDPGSVTVTRGTQTNGAVTVAYSVTGTATSGADFTALSGSVTIPDGQSSSGITVTPLDDAVIEGAETVTLTLQSGAGYTLGASTSGSVTIGDDDGAMKPQVGISFSTNNLTEGTATPLTVTLTRTGPTTTALAVSLSVTGDAGLGTDYADFPLNRSISAGAASTSFDVAITDDALVESAETISLTVIPTTAYDAAANDSATLTIADNDTPPPAATVEVSVVPAQAEERGATSGVFTFTRTGSTAQELTVNLGVAGTATSGSDYAALPPSITFAIGAASAVLSCQPQDDLVDAEGTETVIIGIAPGSGYAAGTNASATFGITDNDTATRFTLGGVTFASPATGPLKLDLFLPRNAATPMPLVITLFGGGWQNGTRGTNGLGAPLNNVGIAVAAVDYRLSGVAKWPAQIHDVKAAIRWLRANAAIYNIDPQRIGVSGSSSGAHLACMAAMTGGSANIMVGGTHVDLEGNIGAHFGQSDAVQAASAWFPPTDLLRMDNVAGQSSHNGTNSPEGNLIGAAIQTAPELSGTANPLIHIATNSPPILLMHGSADTTVAMNQSELLFDRLTRAGRPAHFFPVIGSGHGFGSTQATDTAQWFRRIFFGDATNQAPQAGFTASTFSGTAPLSVNFDASTTTDADGSIAVDAWSFGDGTGASGATASRTFTVPGTYRVTLGILDDDRAVANATTLITVLPSASANPPPTVSITAPVNGFTHLSPAAVHVQAAATGQNGATILNVDFFVNGTLVGADNFTPFGLSIGSLPAGTHALTARATDNSGAQSMSAAVSIIVKSAQPAGAFVQDGGQTYFALVHHRLPAITNRISTLEASTNLLGWSPLTTPTTTQNFGIVEQATLRDATPASGFTRRFLRLKTTRSAP